MIRILLVEDQRVLREALVALLSLEDDIKVVGTTERGDEVPGLVAATDPHVVVLDIGLPDVSGLTVVAQLREGHPAIRVLLLTSLDKPGTVREALTLGVNGFLPKGVSSQELITAIRQIHAGRRVISSELMSDALSVGDNPLTARERQILQLVADGTPPPDIARQLYLAEGTVRNHITRIIGKLAARNVTESVRVAVRQGWI
ncbi:response regulator [Amycolatopsis suaedae]|uniref:Response regulator transcription factor n=1 Tax=Amycolatopsis suaedae TaxID=2510978 RepID=A0A4Q7J411_9PSEU|nr:response regulator transcription factor [Amycolatopsis suaedae]RZQ62260.1 response regulator transcription factor [Amycolatopsis suaedae]